MTLSRPFALLVLLSCVSLVPGAALAEQPANSEPHSLATRLLALHARHAADYRIDLDAARRHPLEFRRQPVYVWTNPVRNGGQDGAVFLWTSRGRPHAVGCIFSFIEDGVRKIHHEFHTLSPEILRVEHSWPGRWAPRAGLTLEPVSDAPPPADEQTRRSLQLRALARRFSARSVVPGTDERWELRLLPQPLHRYRDADGGILDGALLAFVTTAGTDPELFLLLEARETAAGATWQYALARFSDLNLFAKYQDNDVWSAVRGQDDTLEHDAQHRYRLMLTQDRVAPSNAESRLRPAHSAP